MGEVVSMTTSRRIAAFALACMLSTSPLTAIAAPAAGNGDTRAQAGEEMLVEDAAPASAATGMAAQTNAQPSVSGAGEGSLGEEVLEESSKPADDKSADNAKMSQDAALEATATAELAAEGAAEAGAQDAAEIVAQTNAKPVLHAQAHVQNLGWMPEKTSADNRVTVGTTHQSLRVEALRIWITGAAGAIEGKAHVQDVGWIDWKQSSASSELGTQSQSKRVEALRLRLTPELANAGWHIYYRLHVQDFDWLGWARDGELAGSAGYAKRAESVELRLVGPGEQPPSDAGSPYRDRGYVSQAHVQNIGWQAERSGYSFTVGTTGQSLRVEALTLRRPSDDRSGDVVYEAHVQDIGWQGERRNGQVAGTSGQSKRVEAIRVRLTGDLDRDYDVWYRVHAQDIGWMGWTKDGEKSGTQGIAKRLEAVQVAFVAKGAPAPAATGQATERPFIDASAAQVSYRSTIRSGALDFVSAGQVSGTTGKSQPITAVAAKVSGFGGSVSYSAHVSDKGWVASVRDGADCGGGTVEALRFSLSGEISRYFDVWYRAHVSQIGWLDWACNGADAGTTGMGLPVEAYQMVLRPKGTGSPGATAVSSFRAVTGDRELDLILVGFVRNVTGTGPDALRRAYNYMRDNYYYAEQNDQPKGSLPTWEVAYAKEIYYNHEGNCYRWASLMSCIARALGYNARTIAGEVTTSRGSGLHGWTEVYMNGGTYILDPNLEHSYHLNHYLVTYATAPTIYYR